MRVSIFICVLIFLSPICTIHSFSSKAGQTSPHDYHYPNHHPVQLSTPIHYDSNLKKLLLCGGQKQYEYPTKPINKGWVTIDEAPEMEPDILADLRNDSTWKKLAPESFDVVMDEFCDFSTSHELPEKVAKIVKSGGIFFSKLCRPFESLDGAKKELLATGFKDVYFLDESVREALSTLSSRGGNVSDRYWFKNLEKNHLIDVFKAAPLTKANVTPCPWGQGYTFLAIK